MARRRKPEDLIDVGAFSRAKGLFFGPRGQMSGQAVEALAGEVIQRLSHRSTIARHAAETESERIARLVEDLAHAVLSEDESEATEIVMEARGSGMAVEVIYLGLLAGTARRLGQWWHEDRISSLEVVIGAGRIYAIMRGLRRLFGPGTWRGDRFRAVFASVPGETHILGVTMAADLLSLHGWEIHLRAGLDHDTLLAEIGAQDYPIIGLSASTPRMLFPLARLIVALRVSNPGAWIMACGGIVEQEPDVVHLVDADAAAADLPMAEAMMEAYAAALKAGAAR